MQRGNDQIKTHIDDFSFGQANSVSNSVSNTLSNTGKSMISGWAVIISDTELTTFIFACNTVADWVTIIGKRSIVCGIFDRFAATRAYKHLSTNYPLEWLTLLLKNPMLVNLINLEEVLEIFIWDCRWLKTIAFIASSKVSFNRPHNCTNPGMHWDDVSVVLYCSPLLSSSLTFASVQFKSHLQSIPPWWAASFRLGSVWLYARWLCYNGGYLFCSACWHFPPPSIGTDISPLLFPTGSPTIWNRGKLNILALPYRSWTHESLTIDHLSSL